MDWDIQTFLSYIYLIVDLFFYVLILIYCYLIFSYLIYLVFICLFNKCPKFVEINGKWHEWHFFFLDCFDCLKKIYILYCNILCYSVLLWLLCVFLCPTDRIKQTVRLEVKSSQNVNDPAVKTEILLQVNSYKNMYSILIVEKLTESIA